MRSLIRLVLALGIVVLTNSTVQAVTNEECQENCQTQQWFAAQACQDSCATQCQLQGMIIRINQYIPFGCFANPTEEFCIVDGECVCECFLL